MEQTPTPLATDCVDYHASQEAFLLAYLRRKFTAEPPSGDLDEVIQSAIKNYRVVMVPAYGGKYSRNTYEVYSVEPASK